MCKCRSHGTFPLFGLQSSHLNICYYHQDLHRRLLRPGSRPGFYGDRRALLLIGAWPLPRRPGIGHALKRHPFSGLVDSAGMLSLEPFSEDQGRSAVHPRGIPPISFLAPYGFSNPLTRTHVRLLGPCFKTGRMGSPQADARSTLVPKHAETARAGFHDRGDDVSTGVSKARAWAATTIRVGPRRPTFSSFPRGTCSLSVSRPYLALDGIYRPIRAAFPNNPTRRQRLVVRQGPGTTGLSPSPAPLSRGLGPGPPLRTLLQTTIRTPRATDSQAGLFPAGFDNDPSAGSPTETLLRLLLPLNDKVQWTSRDVAGSEPPTSPRSEHFTGPFNRAGGTTRPIKARSASPASRDEQTVLTVRRTGRPTPRSNYELFNCNNLNIRYWSWNYTRLLAPDLPSNGSSLRDLDCTHSNYQTRRARINQVAFLRDVRPACSSTHYLGRGEAITGQDHRSCRGTKCTSYERPGPRPYAHEIFRIQNHDRASMHRRGRIMPIDTLGTSSTTEVHQAATRSLDEEG
ncbi:hypothetical protein V6N13_022477 [Hibiscus sabdariffa]